MEDDIFKDFVEESKDGIFNMKNESLSAQNENIFALMHEGDKLMKQVRQKVTMVVGRSRSGKSTFFNWITGRHLIGVADDRGQLCYKTIEKNCAEVGDGYTSVTTFPNIYQVNDDETLLDMAGFFDEGRNASTVLIVSYMLKVVMDNSKKLRFALVVSEKNLDIADNSVIAIFDAFLQLFNQTLKVDDNQFKKIISKILHSVKLIVVRSEKPLSILPLLQKILKHVKQNTNMKCKNRKFIYALLNAIIANNRVFTFELAIHNKKAPECNFFSLAQMEKWQFFDLLKDTQSIGQEHFNSFINFNINPAAQQQKKLTKIKQLLFLLPFKEQHDKLNREEKKYLKTTIAKRIQSFQVYIQILKDIFDEVILECERLQLDTPQIVKLKEQIELFVYENKNTLLQKNVLNEIVSKAKKIIQMREDNFLKQQQQLLDSQWDKNLSLTLINGQKNKLRQIKKCLEKKQKTIQDINKIMDILNWQAKYFRRFQSFVKENDCYQTLSFLPFLAKQTEKNASGVVLLQEMLSAYEHTTELKDSQQFDQISVFHNYLIDKYLKVAEIVKKNFGGIAYRERLFCQIEYILKRGCREINMLYQIATSEVQANFRSVKQKLQNMFRDRDPQSIIRNYFKNTSHRIKQEHLKTEKGRVCFQKMLNILHEKGCTEQLLYQRTSIIMHDILVESLLKKATSKEWNKSKKAKSLLKQLFLLLNATDVYEESYEYFAEDNEEGPQIKMAEINKTCMKRKQILNEVIQCLTTLRKYNIALKIAIAINCVYSADKLFKIINQNQSKKINKINAINQYATFCVQWGNPTKAIELYQQKIYLSSNVKQIKTTSEMILSIMFQTNMISGSKLKQQNSNSLLSSHHIQLQNNVILGVKAKQYYKNPTFIGKYNGRIKALLKQASNLISNQQIQESQQD